MAAKTRANGDLAPAPTLGEPVAQNMCPHLKDAAARKTAVKPSGPGCEECLKSGDVWVNLRLCLTCGHVGCCDNSPNRHATKHFKKTKHPVIRSYEPDEAWAYCFIDEDGVEVFAAHPGESATKHFDPPSEP